MRTVSLGLGLALLPAALLAEPSPGREDLALLAQRLETAAARVSVASPAYIGSPAERAYRVPGVGAFVVLAPRVLASSHVRLLLPLAAPPAPHSVVASRSGLERAILELRSSLERTVPSQAALSVTDADLRALERDAGERLAQAARARAEAFRALADAMSTMPEMPRLTLGPAATPMSTAAGTARVRLVPRPSPRPDDTVSRVRTALRAALPEVAATLAGLPENESVSIAVDFVAPGSWPGSAPQRTLVMRARVADLREAVSGDRPFEDLPVEVLEY